MTQILKATDIGRDEKIANHVLLAELKRRLDD